jgi:hypothetical protein
LERFGIRAPKQVFAHDVLTEPIKQRERCVKSGKEKYFLLHPLKLRPGEVFTLP